MKANQAYFAITTMAHVLGVSKSGYYDWRDRAPGKRAGENAELRERIEQIHHNSDRRCQ